MSAHVCSTWTGPAGSSAGLTGPVRSVMADRVPPLLLEACVLLGASEDKLADIHQAQFNSDGSQERPLLEPEVLHVLAPPFFSGPSAEGSAVRSHGKKRWSLHRRMRNQPPSAAGALGQDEDKSGANEDVVVPKELDLRSLPPLCFPDGLHLTREEKSEQFHFLVFTDVFGNKTHGVVMQYYRPVLEVSSLPQKGAGPSGWTPLFSAYSFCVISKYPYFTALKDCLTCLSIQLRTSRLSDMEELLEEFAAKLALVPIPPPGHLHLMFHLHPLTIMLPSREDKDHPVVDLDLHLPLLCFQPRQLLQVLSCLLQEQRLVLFSADFARLTLVAESFLLLLQPLSWQQPYVPVLSRSMLDFLMVPTALLMGCHVRHFEEVAAETDDLILVNIDDGSVSTSSSETVELPEVPLAAADCFTQRCASLEIHFDLHQCQRVTSTDVNEQRARRRAWQQQLNHEIQRIALELMVNIFRDVGGHLTYEHRVFNSEDFLKTREPAEQPFYRKVLETHVFHSFLRDRLNRKMDNFARVELRSRSEMQRMKAMVEDSRRPTMQEIQAQRRSSAGEAGPGKTRGMSLPNLAPHQAIRLRSNSLAGLFTPEPAFRSSPKPVAVFRLPDFPTSMSFQSTQTYYCTLIQRLDEEILSLRSENPSLLARFFFLRGFINALCSRRLDALVDFQNLYRTDTSIFPAGLVTWLVESLREDERQLVDKRTDLKRLLLKVQSENEKLPTQPDNRVKRFKLPRKPLRLEEFVCCVQESAIVKHLATIHRLYDALADAQSKQVEPEMFRVFYTSWKEAEAEARHIGLPSEVIDRLDDNECVYKLSSCVKTSCGVGKIAMTQKRLFMLTQGQPGFLEITKFRDIQAVKIATAPFLLVRIPSLRIRTSSRPEVFEANLKTETELWDLLVREMWAGRKMADQHKDPQYMAQALTNVLLMDAVMGCPQNHKPIVAASKLAYFDKIIHEASMTVTQTTSEMLKHKINPSLNLPEPQNVKVLLYTPGQLTCSDSGNEMNPKLWVALEGGRVVVFDASTWSMLQDCIQVGESQLNCMLGLVHGEVWIGSQDSIIYIIDTQSMSCNKQLTEHRHEVTGLTAEPGGGHYSQQTFSCSCDGTVLQWDSVSLKVRKQHFVSCDRLSSIQVHNSTLWCCCSDSIVELNKSGIPQRRISLPEDLRGRNFSCFIFIPQRRQLWAGCTDSGQLFLWHPDHRCTSQRISLPGASGITCMIQVKNQVWVGCNGSGDVTCQYEGQMRGLVMVMDPESCSVTKELQAHRDSIQTLCSAEDRYILSGSTRLDGKIAIWNVE
ncbi:DENN domain-containing protein 3-like isoform X1 [Takifugu rubripes]|uniref:DENN domain containing 3 n=3 Tax=Takifugu rubripes TaxID=31033 RepID=A0A674MB27_TAKRU|nr:DENN domain-containing protein 3-like isoform X1 [Takifugu rubripes]XP_029695040.1 DENN domain-containing protein 3-like isoform X1 [Takifugu rubripes]